MASSVNITEDMLTWKHGNDRSNVWRKGNGGANQVAVLQDKPFVLPSISKLSPSPSHSPSPSTTQPPSPFTMEVKELLGNDPNLGEVEACLVLQRKERVDFCMEEIRMRQCNYSTGIEIQEPYVRPSADGKTMEVFTEPWMYAERQAVVQRLQSKGNPTAPPLSSSLPSPSPMRTNFQLFTLYQGVNSVEDVVKMSNTKPLAYSKRNQGWYGAGPYFTTELGYARLYGHIVMAFTVAIFKPFAVLHGPTDKKFSMYGRRITAGSDCHVAAVAFPDSLRKSTLPVLSAHWNKQRTALEFALNEGVSVLPRCVLIFNPDSNSDPPMDVFSLKQHFLSSYLDSISPFQQAPKMYGEIPNLPNESDDIAIRLKAAQARARRAMNAWAEDQLHTSRTLKEQSSWLSSFRASLARDGLL
eukprot:m.321303 g.321303  ORF g.321303 m.321303 type:complete len:413 (+) comp16527_c0_seq13:208-1446(+)